MKRSLSLFRVFQNALMALLYGVLIAIVMPQVPVLAAAAVIFSLGFLLPGKIPGVAMAIQREVWVRDIAENLFPSNTFMSRSIDDTSFVIDGKVVHLPQSGANPTVEKNRSSLPATIAKRTDTEVTYNLDEYTTDPILLQYTEEVELSYEKRQSILSQHLSTLNEAVANDLIYYWAGEGADYIIRTSGGTGRAAKAPGQTGNRKPVVKDDMIKIVEKLNAADVPQNGRLMVVDPYLLGDIMGIDDFMSADKYGSSNIPSGAIGRIYGIDVYTRSSTVRYDNTATPVRKAPGAANAGTDNLSIVAFHSSFVRRAMGEIKPFEDNDKPEYYGDVFSMLVRAGGRKAYSSGKGTVSLVEAAV